MRKVSDCSACASYDVILCHRGAGLVTGQEFCVCVEIGVGVVRVVVDDFQISNINDCEHQTQRLSCHCYYVCYLKKIILSVRFVTVISLLVICLDRRAYS